MFNYEALMLKNYTVYIMFLEMNKLATSNESSSFCNQFKFFLVELIESIKDIALSIESASESNIPEYSEYVANLSDIINAYSVKGEDENPIIYDTGMISINPDKITEYKTEIDNLIEKYHDVLTARQNEVNKIKEYMDKEISVNLPICSFDIIPDRITMEQMRLLRHVIKKD